GSSEPAHLPPQAQRPRTVELGSTPLRLERCQGKGVSRAAEKPPAERSVGGWLLVPGLERISVLERAQQAHRPRVPDADASLVAAGTDRPDHVETEQAG